MSGFDYLIFDASSLPNYNKQIVETWLLMGDPNSNPQLLAPSLLLLCGLLKFENLVDEKKIRKKRAHIY